MPGNAWFELMRQGVQCFSSGNLGAALNFFHQMTQIDPSRAEGWINLSSALVAAKNFSAGLAAVEKAIQLNPNFMPCYMIRGDIFRELGSELDALSDYRRAVYLHRDPHSLNRLACALRSADSLSVVGASESELLYLEAIELAPNFTLAKVNLASLYLYLGKSLECSHWLQSISSEYLSQVEKCEYESIKILLQEYDRLKEPLHFLINYNDDSFLLEQLKAQPKNEFGVDVELMEKLMDYAQGCIQNKLSGDEFSKSLPEDWSVIEGLFMIPYVETVDEYFDVLLEVKRISEKSKNLQESIGMIAAIEAAKKISSMDMCNPILSERHLRYWHGLACKDIPGFSPGHFKYNLNKVHGHEMIKRVEPVKAAGTFRAFMEEIYMNIPHGLPRAMIVLMAVCDMHPFADGNGRTALIWLNRELEWAGLMPALFDRKLGFKGELGRAMMHVRSQPNDFSPLVTVIKRGQIFARDFCERLYLVSDEKCKGGQGVLVPYT